MSAATVLKAERHNVVMPAVFVSHAFDDRGLVDRFVDTVLKLGCGLAIAEIFYSSGEDTGIPSGRDLIHHVREEVSDSSLVLAIITPIFQTRPVCVAELGAAWGRSDNLFPLAAPGMSRTDMDGVLQGMTIRYLDDSGALDELRDRIKSLTGIESATATWGRHKGQWLREIDGLASALPRPELVTPEELQQAESDLEGAQAALGDAEAEVAELRQRIKDFQAAETAEARKRALLPKDEKQKFEALVSEARTAARAIKHPIVRQAMYYERFGEGMALPDRYDDQPGHDAALAAKEAGFLQENSDDLLVPDDQVRTIARAQAAVDNLNGFLREVSEEFDEWFQEENGEPPQLRRKGVWDELIG